MTTVAAPRCDHIEHHPDAAVTAYTYLSHDEPTMQAMGAAYARLDTLDASKVITLARGPS